MAVTPTNLLQGPAVVYHGAFGATEPANAEAVPGVGWTDMGGTDGGVTGNLQNEYSDLEVDQVPMAVDARLLRQAASVVTSLAEVTLANIRRGLNMPTSVDTDIEWGGDDIVNASPNFSAILLQGTKPGGGPRIVVVRRVLSVAQIAMSWTKDGKTMIPVEFRAYYVSQSVKAVRIDDTEAA